MIIQCEKCQTRFRLDDSRVTDKGAKVRCTKCKHVFTVQKEEPDKTLAEFSSPLIHTDTATDENQPVAADSSQDASFASDDSESVDFSSFETSTFDSSALSFPSDESPATSIEDDLESTPPPVVNAGEVDFSGFDFGEADSAADVTPHSTISIDDFTDAADEPAPTAPKKEALQGLDFSDDDMFGAVVQPTPELSSDTITFDFGEDSFTESMDMGGQDKGGKNSALFSLDSPAEVPFNLGEIDFGDELTSVAVQQVNPEDLKPSQEILFGPLAEARGKSRDEDLTISFIGEEAADELPPLSIASRRKQSPLFGGLIAVVALLVISVLGYFGYSSLSTPKENTSIETGKIGTRAVKATFIKNNTVGELLVISGEAINEYPKPRAALQVKATVFDASGQSVATASAYGGNPLTEEQLHVMTLDKIEAAMANQFGDSLANMEVAPGKAIPFVVVLANLPKGARDFAVQSAGSTVATGKQQ